MQWHGHGNVRLELRPRGGRYFADIDVTARIHREAVRRNELSRLVPGAFDVAEARGRSLAIAAVTSLSGILGAVTPNTQPGRMQLIHQTLKAG